MACKFSWWLKDLVRIFGGWGSFFLPFLPMMSFKNFLRKSLCVFLWIKLYVSFFFHNSFFVWFYGYILTKPGDIIFYNKKLRNIRKLEIDFFGS